MQVTEYSVTVAEGGLDGAGGDHKNVSEVPVLSVTLIFCGDPGRPARHEKLNIELSRAIL